MSKTMKYKYVQSFIVDAEDNKVIETRYIKRIYIEGNEESGSMPLITETQVLKSKIIRHSLSKASKSLSGSILIQAQKAREIEIEKKEFNTYMEKSFNLFKLEPLF